MKKKKRWFHNLTNLIFLAIFIAGLAIFFYPSASNYINSKSQSKAISTYDEALANMSKEDYERYWQAAYQYNENLYQKGSNFALSDEEMKEYYEVLDPTGTGIMGHIEIENIGVDLPIYHGVDETVLQVGIGHLPGTSLPVGTTNSHAVLSGHRGLPSSKLFSDLDQMIVGDTFLLHIMDQTFAYEVDQINIVLPEETGGLGITSGEDYVTLVTCTPYGVNTHRLLVRARRVDYNEETKLIVPADATRYNYLVVAPFIAAPMILILFIWFMVSTSKPRKKPAKGKKSKGSN
ncbi:class C sortase [Butyrivibrio sp. MB2005]|uniref:class C sortase n=1 Tax=Butyrivibrio sp. MB2005 TaxID=1280678 RepID=UPI00041F59B8|nr:class C sortase [Butyrivibrio sp. MB2005]